jgi:hypothetical protein
MEMYQSNIDLKTVMVQPIVMTTTDRTNLDSAIILAKELQIIVNAIKDNELKYLFGMVCLKIKEMKFLEEYNKI